MSTANLFVYGTLRDPSLVASLVGRPLPTQPARLDGWRREEPPGSYAFLVEDPLARVEGFLLRGLDPGALDRLDEYEGVGELYRRIVVEVRVEPGFRIPAFTYVGIPGSHAAAR